MERSYSRYLLLVLCIAVVCTTLVLLGLNAYIRSNPTPGAMGSNSLPSDQATSEAYRQGFEAAKTRFMQYGLGTQSNTNVMEGTVRQTSGGKLIVEQENLMTDAFVSGISDDREVAITASTKITRESQKSADQLAADQAAFAKLPPSPTTQPPSPIALANIRLGDVKIGDRVRVVAQENDVTNLQSVTALSITVISK